MDISQLNFVLMPSTPQTLHTWGDSEGGLRASTATGNVCGDAAVISSICPLHSDDLKNTTGQDCDSVMTETHTQIQYRINH